MIQQLINADAAEFLAPLLHDPRHPSLSRFWQSLGRHEAHYLSRWRQHRLTPLLYWRMSHLGQASAFSPELWQALQEDYAVALANSSWQEAEVGQLLETFHQAGIDAILLKGIDLRQRIYEDTAVRGVDDVDMLIAPQALREVKALLIKQGYQPESSASNWYSNLREVFSYYFKFSPPDGQRLPLDLHWALHSDVLVNRIPFAALRQAAQTLNYRGVPALVLAPEHLLLHLCLHALDHSLYDPEAVSSLGQKILDILTLLGRLPIDWPRFLTEVERFGCAAQISYLLTELARSTPVNLPSWVLTALRKNSIATSAVGLWHLQKATLAFVQKTASTQPLASLLETAIIFASFFRSRLRPATFRDHT